MKLTKLSNIFHIEYGNSFELNSLTVQENKQENSINYISRTAQNNGVSAFVEKIETVEPFSTGLITVAVSGSVLETFLQPEPFYTGYHVMVLTPKKEMSELEKLYYCDCIRKNKYRYSYGRQANRTLKDILVPSEKPKHLDNFEIPNYQVHLSGNKKNLLENQNLVKVSELFEVHYGTNLALNALEEVEQKDENSVNFVSRTTKNNGVSAFVKILPNLAPLPAGLLSVAAGGSVLETFVQDEPFYTGRDMYYLVPKREMSISEKLFYAFCIRANKYRYNYNRQANRTLRDLKIPANLPTWFDKNSIEQQLKDVMT